MPDLSVDVTCTAPKYWVCVDSTDMVDENGNHSPRPFVAGEHWLFWYMAGAPTDTISIQIKNGAAKLGNPIKGGMPNGENAAGDHAIFNI